MKKEVQEEILALLDATIDNEIAGGKGFLTVAEIASEVLMQKDLI